MRAIVQAAIRPRTAMIGILMAATRVGQRRIEWLFLSLIAAVCALLSFLQYRWTGELSRAEPVLLRAGLNEQLRRVAQTFDNEIRESCTALMPDAKTISEVGAVSAHSAKYLQWAPSHERPLFSKIGFAVPEQGTLKLYGIGNDGQIAPMEWPLNWYSVRAGMEARMTGEGRPPEPALNSTVIETPVFSRPPQRGEPGSELEWMIFDLNEEYVRDQVLPPLLREYLNPDGSGVYDVSVSWSTPGKAAIYSNRDDHSSVASKADATIGIFNGDMGMGLRGRDRLRGDRQVPRWTVAVRHRAGSLDEAVSHARTRNLVASLILVALLGGTAWALVQYTARSRRLSEMQFRFATGVSHDLRTPLTAIRGAAFNLVEGIVQEPAAIKRYSKLILRNAEELTSMIENVLAFSASMQSSKDHLCGAVAVGELLQHATSAMMAEIEQAGCRIDVTVAPGLPSVSGDPVAIELVFRNLIGNAVRHGAEGKWIGVSAAQSGEEVEVRFCDHGPGVPEAEQQRIFEPFYRGEQTRAQRVPGTGLGLSLVKNTIESCRGTVQVRNASGGGAQFVVRFPAASEAA